MGRANAPARSDAPTLLSQLWWGARQLPNENELARHFTPAERDDLELVTIVITIANRSANTLDALLARLRGRPLPGSRLRDELVLGTGVALPIAPVAGSLALARRRSRAVIVAGDSTQ